MRKDFSPALFEDLNLCGEKMKALSSLMVDAEGDEHYLTRSLGYLLCDCQAQVKMRITKKHLFCTKSIQDNQIEKKTKLIIK